MSASITHTADGGTVFNASTTGSVASYLATLSEPGADTPDTFDTVSMSVVSTNMCADGTGYAATTGEAGHVVTKALPDAMRSGTWAINVEDENGDPTDTWLVGEGAYRHICGLLGTHT